MMSYGSDLPESLSASVQEKYTVAKILETGAFVKDFSVKEVAQDTVDLMQAVSATGRFVSQRLPAWHSL